MRKQIIKIISCMGEPTDAVWPGWKELRDSHKFKIKPVPATPLAKVIPAASTDALALLGKMLFYDPNKRITAEQALQDPYLSANPLPSNGPTLAQRVSDYLEDRMSTKKAAAAPRNGQDDLAGTKRKQPDVADSPRYG
mmetsp:Transcript_36335/g.72942  ORF Transcript_36335/g.72942 Transcript_36335/m.72942 type:complete len:138 (+) Transcript_36335:39-452(+)